jgi:hypothetical protein
MLGLSACYVAALISVHTLDAIALVTGPLIAFGTPDSIGEKIVRNLAIFAVVERALAPVVVHVCEIDHRHDDALVIAFEALAIPIDLGCDGAAASLKLTHALNAPSSPQRLSAG